MYLQAPYADSLPFGEQLVLETYMRCQRRPLDRQRVEELARPKRHGPTFMQNLLVSANTKSASPDEIANIVGRLTQPKKSHAAAAQTSLSTPKSGDRNKSFDLDAMVRRLTAPKPMVQPSPAEQVIMRSLRDSDKRAVDLERLTQMARPRRAGASCLSWGVNPDWVKDVETPRSSRSVDIADGGFRTLGANIAATPRAPATAPAAVLPTGPLPMGPLPTSACDYAPRQQQELESPSKPWEQGDRGPPAAWKQPQSAAWEQAVQKQEEASLAILPRQRPASLQQQPVSSASQPPLAPPEASPPSSGHPQQQPGSQPQGALEDQELLQWLLAEDPSAEERPLPQHAGQAVLALQPQTQLGSPPCIDGASPSTSSFVDDRSPSECPLQDSVVHAGPAAAAAVSAPLRTSPGDDASEEEGDDDIDDFTKWQAVDG